MLANPFWPTKIAEMIRIKNGGLAETPNTSIIAANISIMPAMLSGLANALNNNITETIIAEIIGAP